MRIERSNEGLMPNYVYIYIYIYIYIYVCMYIYIYIYMAAYREGGKFLTKRQQSRSKRKFVLSSHRKHWSVTNTKLKQARGLIISCKNSKKKDAKEKFKNAAHRTHSTKSRMVLAFI